jgi:L-threonine-O-3-phosphate decarboxylase
MAAAIDQLRHYPDPDYRELRTALGDYHGVHADWVLPGNGAAELLTWAARDMAGQGSSCQVMTPAFGDYRRALAAAGVALSPWALPLGSAQADLDPWPAPEAACLLLNNPHNPTGRLFAAAELLPLLERFAIVVVDEAFMDFLPPDRQQSLVGWLEQYPNVVVLRSLTKFYTLPGLRIGYALGHPDRLRRWQAWRDPWPVNALAAAAAIAAVQDEAFQALTWRWLDEARSALLAGLQAISGLAPLTGSANYLLVKTAIAAPALQAALLTNHRILIRDCLSFPELGEDYFRIAVRKSVENQHLLTALSQEMGV